MPSGFGLGCWERLFFQQQNAKNRDLGACSAIGAEILHVQILGSVCAWADGVCRKILTRSPRNEQVARFRHPGPIFTYFHEFHMLLDRNFENDMAQPHRRNLVNILAERYLLKPIASWETWKTLILTSIIAFLHIFAKFVYYWSVFLRATCLNPTAETWFTFWWNGTVGNRSKP